MLGVTVAKRHRQNLITASFHYLVKGISNEEDPQNPVEGGFSRAEFERVIARISDQRPLDESDAVVIANIKEGKDIPFSDHQEIRVDLHFGAFDGAYYGHRYRNNEVGAISAESLNLRGFHYLLAHLRDGKILVGVTYNGQFGDFLGIKSCLSHILRGNHTVKSRSITSISDEIGDGVPVELKLTYRKASDRPERRNLFGKVGVIAIKAADFGEQFGDEVARIAQNVTGDTQARRRSLARIVNQGNVIELDDDDIVGCSAVVRTNGRTSTVFLIGGNNMATKFRLNVQVDNEGIPARDQVRDEMLRVMRERVMPLLA